MPLVTIIVATYNRKELLNLSLQSILAQEFTDFEVQVVGDGCTDGSEEIVALLNDPRLIWTNLEKRVGNQAGPNNLGLEKAKGEYIAYLGHDDLWFPWHLQNLVNHLTAGKEFAFSLSALIEPQTRIEPYGVPAPHRKLKYHFAPPSTCLHTRTLLDKIGGWRLDVENLLFDLDRELFHRVVTAGALPKFSPQLSVLKFPSTLWRTYALSEFPQHDYSENMRRDPKQLQIELLNRMAVMGAIDREAQRPYLRKKICSLLDAYGREKWPVSEWMNWKIRKEIKERLTSGGLIDLDTKTFKKP